MTEAEQSSETLRFKQTKSWIESSPRPPNGT